MDVKTINLVLHDTIHRVCVKGSSVDSYSLVFDALWSAGADINTHVAISPSLSLPLVFLHINNPIALKFILDRGADFSVRINNKNALEYFLVNNKERIKKSAAKRGTSFSGDNVANEDSVALFLSANQNISADILSASLQWGLHDDIWNLILSKIKITDTILYKVLNLKEFQHVCRSDVVIYKKVCKLINEKPKLLDACLLETISAFSSGISILDSVDNKGNTFLHRVVKECLVKTKAIAKAWIDYANDSDVSSYAVYDNNHQSFKRIAEDYYGDTEYGSAADRYVKFNSCPKKEKPEIAIDFWAKELLTFFDNLEHIYSNSSVNLNIADKNNHSILSYINELHNFVMKSEFANFYDKDITSRLNLIVRLFKTPIKTVSVVKL